jgi:hypothetical protein
MRPRGERRLPSFFEGLPSLVLLPALADVKADSVPVRGLTHAASCRPCCVRFCGPLSNACRVSGSTGLSPGRNALFSNRGTVVAISSNRAWNPFGGPDPAEELRVTTRGGEGSKMVVGGQRSWRQAWLFFVLEAAAAHRFDRTRGGWGSPSMQGRLSKKFSVLSCQSSVQARGVRC